MKKLLSVLLMMTMILSLVCVSVSAEEEVELPVLAYPSLAYGEVLYSADFSTVPAGVQTGDGTLAVEDGKVRLTGVNGDFWYVLAGTDTLTDNIIVSLDVAVVGTGAAAGVGFRKAADNGNSGWDVNWMRSTGVCTMARPYAGQNNYDAAGLFMYDQTYNITLVITGATVAVYHNGVHMVDMDASANATGGGAISLNAYASEVLYDNIVVYSIGTGDPVQPPTAGGEDEGGEEEGAPDTSDIMTGSIVLAVVALSVGVVASKKRFGR